MPEVKVAPRPDPGARTQGAAAPDAGPRGPGAPGPASQAPASPPHASPPQASPPHASPPQASPPHALPPQASQAQALPGQALPPHALPPQALHPQALQQRGAPAPAPASQERGAGAGVAAIAAGAGTSLLFLREEQMRLAQDLMFFAYRDFTGAADLVLAELGLGRAHHRALHFVGRNPGITVSDLLGLLRITKQSLARVLGALVTQGYVSQVPGRSDRRQRLLALTPKGDALERRLFERQRDRLAAAYREAGGPAVEGFRRVMRGVMDHGARSYLDAHEPGGRARVG